MASPEHRVGRWWSGDLRVAREREGEFEGCPPALHYLHYLFTLFTLFTLFIYTFLISLTSMRYEILFQLLMYSLETIFAHRK